MISMIVVSKLFEWITWLFQKAVCVAQANTYIAALVVASPFHTRFMREFCSILYTPVMLSWCDIRARLQTYVCTLFSGWLQTKVVEDVFQDARRRETHDVENKQLKISTYYARVAAMDTIGEHHRQEIQPEDDEPKASGTTKDVFYAQRHHPSLVSAGDITGHCDWQTFSAQSSKTIDADIFITRCMYLSDRWEMSSKCWQASLLPKRCVVKVKAGRGQPDEIVMVVGLMAIKVLIGWK